MPPTKTPSSAANGVAGNVHTQKAQSVDGKAKDLEADENVGAASRISRPDRAVYTAEQEAIKKDIEAVRVKLNSIQEIINTGKGSDNARLIELRAEWDKIRTEQSQNKNSRGRYIEQLKALNDTIQKKVKDLQASKAKIPFKTVAEVDAHIKQLERRVESGSLTLAEEKRALQEITQCRRSRKTVENFETEQETIERDRAAAEEIRKKLDDPDAKAVSERADAVKAELDKLKEENDIAYNNRNKLFQERNDLRTQLDALYDKKKDSAQKFKEENDRYQNKVNEDRARKAEKLRAQRLAEEEQKKKELLQRLREEAETPAFQIQIEDCQTLIDYFSGNVSSSSVSTILSAKTEVAGVPKLDIRKVADDTGESLVARKKKGDEETYFVASKKKGKKGGIKADGDSTIPSSDSMTSNSQQLNVPLSILSALLSLSIPPPSSLADVPRAISDLQTKKAWYEANQPRVTQENIAKAEANIRKLLNGNRSELILPPNGDGEQPPEPTPTPATASDLSIGVPTDQIDEKLANAQ